MKTTEELPIILWGAAGHAGVIRDIVGKERVIALFDQKPVSPPWDVPFFVGRDEFSKWRKLNPMPACFAIAIGGHRGADRLDLHRYFTQFGLKSFCVRHKNAIVEPSAKIYDGAQLLGGSFVGANATIGRQTILNSNSTVDHDCVISDGVHIAPGATLCGEIFVGEGTLIGAGATILPKLKIGSNVIIGAGSVVTDNVKDGCKMVGSPARNVGTLV